MEICQLAHFLFHQEDKSSLTRIYQHFYLLEYVPILFSIILLFLIEFFIILSINAIDLALKECHVLQNENKCLLVFFIDNNN